MTTHGDSQLERRLKRRAGRRRAIRRVCTRTVAYLMVIIIFMVFYLSIIGVPEPIADKILAEVNKGDIYLQVEKLTLDPFEGIVAVSPRLFRKQVIGSPFIQAEELVFQLNPGNLLLKENILTGIRIYRGKFIEDTGPRSGDPTYLTKIVEGDFLAEKCDIEGTWFESLRCHYRIDGPQLTISDLHGEVGKSGSGGTVKGHIKRFDTEKRIEGRIEGTFMPSEFSDTMTSRRLDGLRKVVSRFDFGDSQPSFSADFEMKWGDSRSFKLTGEGKALDCSYNQVPITSTEFSIAMMLTEDYRSSMSIAPLIIERSDGRIDASLEQNFSRSNLHFNVSSTVNPHALLGLINPDFPRRFQNLHAHGQTSVEGQGVVFYKNPELNRFQLNVKSRGLGLGSFTSTTCDFLMDVNGHHTRLQNVQGTIYDGRFSGDVQFFPDTKTGDTRYTVSSRVDDLNFKKVASVMGEKNKDYTGLLHGQGQLTGVISDTPAEHFAASGSLRITGSKAFKLPIIGDLSRIISSMIPGLDFLHNDTEIKTRLSLADKKIAMEDFSVQGGVLTLAGTGIYHFDRRVDFRVRLKLMKEHTLVGEGLNLIFLPVSSLLEFKLQNTIDKPVWSPLVLPNALKKRLSILPEKKNGNTPPEEKDKLPDRINSIRQSSEKTLQDLENRDNSESSDAD